MPISMSDKFDLIVSDLARCRSSRKCHEVFGASAHRFEVFKPLSEHEVEKFEARYQCHLPDDYRNFVMCVGNGGAGPAYGLFPLGMMDLGHDTGPWGEMVASLKLPFPHKDQWNDVSGNPPDELMEEDEDEYWRQVESFEKRYYSPALTVGSFPICHLGCALRRLLIVTGDQTGEVWCDHRADLEGLFPHSNTSKSRMGFFDWYREWLDECLAKL